MKASSTVEEPGVSNPSGMVWWRMVRSTGCSCRRPDGHGRRNFRDKFVCAHTPAISAKGVECGLVGIIRVCRTGITDADHVISAIGAITHGHVYTLISQESDCHDCFDTQVAQHIIECGRVENA